MRDYQDSVTTEQTDRRTRTDGRTDRHTDRQTPYKVITICRYASQVQHTNKDLINILYVSILFLSNATFTLPVSTVSQRLMNIMGQNRDSVS